MENSYGTEVWRNGLGKENWVKLDLNYQIFIYSSTDALMSCLKNNIKIYIKITF
jgi:hypothetical protein